MNSIILNKMNNFDLIARVFFSKNNIAFLSSIVGAIIAFIFFIF